MVFIGGIAPVLFECGKWFLSFEAVQMGDVITLYDIISRHDFQIGTTLTIRIPKEDVDNRALLAISTDQPDFILPFHHRVIDRSIEFIFHAGNRGKLMHLSGERTPDEYANLLSGILKPILDCQDRLLNLYSFVFQFEYLYCDLNGNAVTFLYIPSKQACSDYYAFKKMVSDVTKQNHVTDIELNNRVLWAIQDFNPNELMQIVNKARSDGMASDSQQSTPMSAPALTLIKAPPLPHSNPVRIESSLSTVGTETPLSDKLIDSSKNGKKNKKRKEKWSFGKKIALLHGVVQDTIVTPNQTEPVHDISATSDNIPSDGSSKSLSNNDDDLTRAAVHNNDTPMFRYVGDVRELSMDIGIKIGDGDAFTIGRVDSTLGVKQSDFEFDNNFRTVSRRHAAVEKINHEYYVIDLGSTTGTYLNGRKVPPNTPFLLENGCHVIFGYSGVHYVWEGI